MISFCFALLRQCLASSAAAEFGLLGLVLNFMYAFLFILFILFTFLLLRLVCECFFSFTAVVVLRVLYFVISLSYSVFT